MIIYLGRWLGKVLIVLCLPYSKLLCYRDDGFGLDSNSRFLRRDIYLGR